MSDVGNWVIELLPSADFPFFVPEADGSVIVRQDVARYTGSPPNTELNRYMVGGALPRVYLEFLSPTDAGGCNLTISRSEAMTFASEEEAKATQVAFRGLLERNVYVSLNSAMLRRGADGEEAALGGAEEKADKVKVRNAAKNSIVRATQGVMYRLGLHGKKVGRGGNSSALSEDYLHRGLCPWIDEWGKGVKMGLTPNDAPMVEGLVVEDLFNPGLAQVWPKVVSFAKCSRDFEPLLASDIENKFNACPQSERGKMILAMLKDTPEGDEPGRVERHVDNAGYAVLLDRALEEGFLVDVICSQSEKVSRGRVHHVGWPDDNINAKSGKMVVTVDCERRDAEYNDQYTLPGLTKESFVVDVAEWRASEMQSGAQNLLIQVMDVGKFSKKEWREGWYRHGEGESHSGTNYYYENLEVQKREAKQVPMAFVVGM